MATMEEVKAFIQKYTPFANDAAAQLGGGVTAGELIAQWAKERGWNTPTAAGGLNNLAGIKAGSRPNNGTFMNYESLNDFVSDFVVQTRKLVTSKEGSNYIEKLANGAWEGYDLPANQTYSEGVKSVSDYVKTIAPELFTGWTPATPAAGSTTPTSKSWILKAADWFGVKYPDEANTMSNTDILNKTLVGAETVNKAADAVRNTVDAIPKAINKIAGLVTGLVMIVLGIWLMTKGESNVIIEREEKPE
jgi:hypothetical protein